MTALGKFAAFIRNEFLEEYVSEYLSIFSGLDVPIMKLFKHLTPEQLREMSKQGVVKFLEGFENGTSLEQAAESLRQWETDTIPGISKKAIHPSDLVLIYSAQKLALNKFLALYTTDVHEAVSIARELEEYYMEVQNNAVQLLFRIQKETEEQLEERNRQLEEAQMLSRIGSWEWNLETGMVTCSREMFRLFHLEPREGAIPADEFTRHMSQPIDPQAREKFIADLTNEGKPYMGEFTLTLPNGENRVLQSRGEPVKDPETGKVKVIGTTQDITQIREAEMQAQLNRQKDEFISIASHELKTPLTSLKAYVQLIDKQLGSDPGNTAGRFAKKALEFTDKLEGLISDLLDVSKIEAGKLQFNMEWFDIDELLRNSIEMTKHSAPHHEIVLEGCIEEKVYADKQRIEQVLLNYLSNAVKYSPKAQRVEVHAKCENNTVEVAVRDFGMGIAKEKQSRIFERFFRVNDNTHHIQGLGIGLYISAEIVKRHKGKVWVESEEGKGSTFYFKIPVK